MVSTGRERGFALLLAIAAASTIACAVLVASQYLQTRFDEFHLEERQVALTALSDAAMAEALAGLARGPGFSGVREHAWADGRIGSEVNPIAGSRVQIMARATRLGWVAEVKAEVDLSSGSPRVLTWQRQQHPE